MLGGGGGAAKSAKSGGAKEAALGALTEVNAFHQLIPLRFKTVRGGGRSKTHGGVLCTNSGSCSSSRIDTWV